MAVQCTKKFQPSPSKAKRRIPVWKDSVHKFTEGHLISGSHFWPKLFYNWAHESRTRGKIMSFVVRARWISLVHLEPLQFLLQPLQQSFCGRQRVRRQTGTWCHSSYRYHTSGPLPSESFYPSSCLVSISGDCRWKWNAALPAGLGLKRDYSGSGNPAQGLGIWEPLFSSPSRMGSASGSHNDIIILAELTNILKQASEFPTTCTSILFSVDCLRQWGAPQFALGKNTQPLPCPRFFPSHSLWTLV